MRRNNAYLDFSGDVGMLISVNKTRRIGVHVAQMLAFDSGHLTLALEDVQQLFRCQVCHGLAALSEVLTS